MALRSGDVIYFNSQLSHCVSSRCDGKRDAFCVSFYVASAVAGGHDNNQEWTVDGELKRKRRDKKVNQSKASDST